MKRALIVLAFLFVAAPALAQTAVYTAASRITFETPSNITTVTEAQTFELRGFDNGVALATLPALACAPAVAPFTGITCSAAMGAANATTLNRLGPHALTVALYRSDLGVGDVSAPFSRPVPAGAPTGVRVPPTP